MASIQGYRTLIFAAVVTLAGAAGTHLAPDTVNHWLDVIFASIGIGIALLRIATTTPIGTRIEAAILPASWAQGLTAEVAKLAPTPDLPAAVGTLTTSLETVAATATVASALPLTPAPVPTPAAQAAPIPTPATAAIPALLTAAIAPATLANS